MHVLVTGGGGYLGCHLVSALLERGHRVRIFDRLCFGREALAPLLASPGVELVEGDIRRLQERPALLQGIDAVAHLASLSNDPSCDLNQDMALDVNLESARELANQAVHNGVRRFVLASSCSVYGRGVFEILDEESPANPVSLFALSKYEAEQTVLRMRGESFEPVVARTATMFGWSPRMRFDLAINHMVASALRTGTIKVMGGGNQWRPFVHVKDAAQAFALLLEAPAGKVSGQVFNVGSDVANTRIIDLANRVANALGNTRIDVAKDDDDRRNFRVQFAKIRETLGFKCTISIDEGIREVHHELAQRDIDPFAEGYFNVNRMKTLLATPVDEGGEPIAARFISVAKPYIGPEEEEAVLHALRSGWLTSGPNIQRFEKAFAETVGARHAVAVISCTAALHLCLAHLNIKPGDEVITSPLTWGSTGNTIINMGARVVFADVDRETLNMSPAALEKAITPRTRAIIPVHMAGLPCDLDAIKAIAERHGIPVIEDAAHAMGAAYKGIPIGAYSPLSCFSFYAIKNITTMEGGIITLDDPAAAERLRLLAFHGIPVTPWERYGRSAVPAPPEVAEPGFKYLMSNVSAAMGVEQLKRFSTFKAARRRLANMYNTVLGDVDEIRLPATHDDSEHGWHLYIIRLNLERLTKNRDEIAAALRRENIGTSINFFGLHLHRYYREVLGMKPDELPNATAASYEVLSLPLHPQMTDRNVHEVIAALKKVLAHARKQA